MTTAFRRTAERRNKRIRWPISPTEKSAKLTPFRVIAPLYEKFTAYLAKIGIGRSLTAPPSHTTWHTGPYQGGSMWLHVVVSAQSEQAHLIKEVIVERHAYARCMTDLPRPFRTPGRRVCQRRGNPALDQLCLASAVPLPVFPLEAPQMVTNPAVQVAQHCGRLAEPKITNPPSQIR